MSAYIENKNVYPLNLDKKEHLQTISFENTLNVNFLSNVNLSTKIGNHISLPDLKSEHKSKTDSNRLRSSSSKVSSNHPQFPELPLMLVVVIFLLLKNAKLLNKRNLLLFKLKNAENAT